MTCKSEPYETIGLIQRVWERHSPTLAGAAECSLFGMWQELCERRHAFHLQKTLWGCWRGHGCFLSAGEWIAGSKRRGRRERAYLLSYLLGMYLPFVQERQCHNAFTLWMFPPECPLLFAKPLERTGFSGETLPFHFARRTGLQDEDWSSIRVQESVDMWSVSVLCITNRKNVVICCNSCNRRHKKD